MEKRDFTPLPGEPSFPLLARDRHAPSAVENWADDRELEIRRGYSGNKKKLVEELRQLAEARKIAEEMRDWRRSNMGVWKGALPPGKLADKIIETGFHGGVQELTQLIPGSDEAEAFVPRYPYMLTGNEELLEAQRVIAPVLSS